MSQPDRQFDITPILLVPSFWGAVGWWISLAVYYLPALNMYRGSWDTTFILLSMGGAFSLSTLAFHRRFRVVILGQTEKTSPSSRLLVRISLHLVGLLGCVLFVWQIEKSGLLKGHFWDVLINNPLQIRSVDLHGFENGIRLSYFGWLAAFMSGAALARRSAAKKSEIGLILLQIVGNLVFISKVRPIAVIALVFFSVIMCGGFSWNLRKTLTATFSLIVLISIFFVGWSRFTGKHRDHGFGVPSEIGTLMMYVASGPALLTYVIDHESPEYGQPYQTLNGYYRVLNLLSIVEPPPSRNSRFYAVPMLTNVGTALCPFYRDLGVLGLVFGIIALSVGCDLLALFSLRAGGTAGFLMAAILCFNSLSAFFADRMANGPTICGLGFLFVTLGLRLVRVGRPIVVHRRVANYE